MIEQDLDFRLLFESAPLPFLVLKPNADFTILGASDAYLHATLTTREGIVGRPLFAVFPDNPNDPSATGARNLRASLARVIANKAPDTMAVQKYDIARPEAEGGGFEERFWSPLNAPAFGPDGQILYIIHRVKDITDFVLASRQQKIDGERSKALELRSQEMEIEILRRSQELDAAREHLQRLNQDLQRHAAELEAANKEIEAFSYSVSHDLRAPLRSIDGFSQAILEDYADRLDEPGRQYLARVRAATSRMGDLIDDLLRLSRVTRAEMTHETVDMSAIVESLAVDLRHSDPQRAVRFAIQPGLEVEGDCNLLRILLTNLISNAWKFTARRDDPCIEFGMHERDGERTYWVRDNGAGFDMAYARKLFVPFQRLHTVTEFPGTGIGLAIVQRIVIRHRGRVWVEAGVDRGATFYFALRPYE